jgi:hypothetical protein
VASQNAKNTRYILTNKNGRKIVALFVQKTWYIFRDVKIVQQEKEKMQQFQCQL